MPEVRRAIRRRCGSGISVLLAGLVAGAATGAAAEETARLERATVPAAGRSVTLLEVVRPGRYSIGVSSRSGVALQVVDRMAGPGPVSGAPGEADGRLDLLLDRGTVRVVTRGSDLAAGEARLDVRRFVERSAEPQPRLVELRPVADELGDFEQRSWWIELGERRTVVIEAAGRQLADLRLWQNGDWLVAAEPAVSTIEPTPGRPLALCQLAADLAPGLYRLTAYGGPGAAWSGAGSEHPLYLLWGDAQRGSAGRERRVVGPLGFDRLLVPGATDFVRLELPAPRAAALELADYDPTSPFPAPGERAEVTEESREAAADLRREPGESAVLVTVRGDPGQAYVLHHAATRAGGFAGRGGRWVTTLHAGAAADSVDASGILLAWRGRHAEPVAWRTPTLDAQRTWARRFNLLAPATLFVRVEAAGDYELTATGAAADFRLEPFAASTPAGYQPPPARRAPARWTLDPGFYVLAMTPLEPGIVEVALRAAGRGDPLAAPGGPALSPVRAAVTLGRVALAPKTRYELRLGSQPGVTATALVRDLPLDLEDPLPVALAPGEVLEVPFRAASAGALAAADESGGPLDVAVDGGEWAAEAEVAAGEHVARVRGRGEATVSGDLVFTPAPRRAPTPLAPLAAATLASRPALPRLAEGEQAFLDLARGASATWEVAAGGSGLYVVETSGLLALAGSMRTRVTPALVAAAENGHGRNVALRAYLRTGDYQVTVRALGESAGHLGVALRRAALREGGELPAGLAAREELAADEAIAYSFDVPAAGDYRLRSLGLRGPLDGRLEDADGWPVAAPVLAGDWTLRLEPGRYRWIVLPRAAAGRAVTRLEAVPAPERLAGHGPHDLPLDVEREQVWREPEAGGERLPDRWRFRLPAPAHVAITLTEEMTGTLVRAGAGRAAVAEVPPGRGWQGDLPAGDYELEARCFRVNNRVAYTVRVAPVELVAGLEREVALPAVVPIAIAGPAQVEIDSSGTADVRARLFDAAGRQVASADDRPGDWNFLIAARLDGGRYRLEVEPVAGEQGTATTVALRVRPTAARETLALPGRLEVTAGEELLELPLAPPAGAELLAVGAASDRALGVELERPDGAGWRTVGSARGRSARLLVPLDAAGSQGWRLRLWSLDRFPAAIRVTGFAGPAPALEESAAADGFELVALPGLEPPTAAVAVRLARPGCFRAVAGGGEIESLLSAPARGRAFAPATGALVALEPTLWLGAPLAAGPAPALAARRATVTDGGAPFPLTLAPGDRVRCDLEAGGGPFAATVATLAGDPLLATGEADGTVHRVGVARHRALALAESGAALSAWQDGPAPVEARLALARLVPQPARAATDGALEVELAPRALVPVTLPPGAKRLRLVLGEGAAAAVGGIAGSEGVHWAAERRLAVTVWTAATEVALLAPGDAPVRARVEWTPARSSPAALAPAAPFESRLERSGRVRLAVAAGAPAGARLRVRGVRSAILLGADGSLARGASLPVPAAGGVLDLDATPGFVAAWIAAQAGAAEAFGFAAAATPVPVSPPAALPLAGREAAFRLDAAASALLSLRATTPMALELVPDAGAPRFEVGPAGLAFDALLPAGGATLRLRALGDEQLSGSAELRLEALAQLDEGLGAPVLLPPGGARGFAFAVARKGPVGVGAAAGERGVETVVFDATGRPLGRGVAQWLDLEPGRYALALISASDSEPVEARPALVGTAAPGTGPPPELVRRFLELERGAPAEVTGTAGVESPRRFDPATAASADEEGPSRGDEVEGADESWDESDEGEVE